MMNSREIARAMYEAAVAGADWPLPSEAMDGFDVAAAYEVQREFVARRLGSDTIAGFKAGATAVPAQQAFGLEAPFVGVLLASGHRAAGGAVTAADFGQLLLETELCFRAGSAIDSRLKDVDSLRACIDGCFPAIELADAGGYGKVKFTGPDLVAGNGASAAYMLGAEPDWRSADMDRVPVSFARDGQILHEAVSGDLMGGPWHALLWLVNMVIDLGYEVQPGQLLLSGALGAPHPAAVGGYVADFGEFGRIAFEVV
jgi:2-keto-4-pentenoate hydratase